MEGSESRLEINVPLLDKALELRRRIASILGYKTWCVRFLFFFRGQELMKLQGLIIKRK
jgi:hypothetical protein